MHCYYNYRQMQFGGTKQQITYLLSTLLNKHIYIHMCIWLGELLGWTQGRELGLLCYSYTWISQLHP